jgi:hypothetical protein
VYRCVVACLALSVVDDLAPRLLDVVLLQVAPFIISTWTGCYNNWTNIQKMILDLPWVTNDRKCVDLRQDEP